MPSEARKVTESNEDSQCKTLGSGGDCGKQEVLPPNNCCQTAMRSHIARSSGISFSKRNINSGFNVKSSEFKILAINESFKTQGRQGRGNLTVGWRWSWGPLLCKLWYGLDLPCHVFLSLPPRPSHPSLLPALCCQRWTWMGYSKGFPCILASVGMMVNFMYHLGQAQVFGQTWFWMFLWECFLDEI